MQPQPMSRIAPFVAEITNAPPSPALLPDTAPARVASLPCLLIRRLGPDDRAALAAHLISLPREDRRTRFSGNIGDPAIQRHCDDLDLEDTVCFAALDEAGDVIGAALGFSYGAGTGSQFAEIAVSVAPEHRRRGLGADLVARVCDAAAARGADAAVFEFDPSMPRSRAWSAISAPVSRRSRIPA